METDTNELVEETSIALGVVQNTPRTGDIWKLSDGNGLIAVTFADKAKDFLGLLRSKSSEDQQDVVKKGDVLICRAIIKQTMHVEDGRHVLSKTVVVTKVTAVSKRMMWGNST